MTGVVDLLAHVLVGYALAATLAHAGVVPERYVPVAMVGSVLPDLSKVEMVVPESAVEAALGVPVSFLVFHRLGGALVLAGVGAALFARGHRLLAFGTLVGAAGVHLVLDGLIRRADGLAPPYLYPFTWYQPPAGGLYVSSDVWPTLVAAGAAGVVWVTTRWRRSGSG